MRSERSADASGLPNMEGASLGFAEMDSNL